MSLPYIDVQYTAGTIKNPQQTKITQAAFTATNGVHFPDGRLTTLPPYQELSTVPGISLRGGCYSVHGTQHPTDGFYYLFGSTNRLTALQENTSTLFNISPFASSSTTLGSNPITTTYPSNANIITVAFTSHGLVAGDRVKISGAADVGGIIAATYINKEHVITAVPNANSFTLTLGASATSAATGGGASVVVYKQMAAGEDDAVFPSIPSIWSYDDFGGDVVLCRGDSTAGDGQKIYIWDKSLTTSPTVLTNAPTDCTFVAVVNNAVVALCGNRIDISEIGDATVWAPGVGTTAYSLTLNQVNRLVAVYRTGEKGALLFTQHEVFLLQYVGEPDYWDVSLISSTEGIVGPQAACELNGTIYWRGFQNLHRYAGAEVETINNPQNGDYITTQMGATQEYERCFVHPDPVNAQVYVFFTAGTSTNAPAEYAIHNPRDGSFTLGTMYRTAAMKRVIGNRFFMAASAISGETGKIYQHFISENSPLSLAISWSFETAESYAGDGSQRFRVDEFIPDTWQNQDDSFNVIFKMREYPQDSTQYSSSTYTVSDSTKRQTVKAAGRLMSISASGSAQMTLGGWKLAIKMLGRH
jgi:hypothetical protein